MTYLLVALMLASLAILLYFTYKPYKNYAGIFKTITSLLFVSISIIGYIEYSGNFNYFVLILVGLVFSLFGDVFLIFETVNLDSMSKAFIYGLLSFSLAHVFFSIGFISISSFNFPTILYTVLMAFIALSILKSIKKIDFKGAFGYVAFYSVVISFMFIQSLNLYFNTTIDSFYILWVIIGALLFVLSDLILAFNYFYEGCHKIVGVFNLLVYFSAQLLLALSVAYI